MNANSLFFLLLAGVLGLIGLDLFAQSVAAADAGSPLLQANLVWEFVANRSRMIQMSFVFVLVGCSLMWWRR